MKRFYVEFWGLLSGVALAVVLFALVACQTATGSFCDLSRPIRPSAEQIDQMTDAQVREYLGHNRRGQELCGWRP